MATSHDIGGMANNQVAAFGNMSSYSRSISPMVPPQFAGQMGQGGGQPSFGMMGMTGAAFTPSGPGFAPPGSFPGQGMQRAGMGLAGAAAQGAGMAIPGKAALGIAGFMMGGPGGAAAGMAAGAAGDHMTSMITMSVQNMNATANMMQSQRFQFGRGMGLPGAGAFGAQQIAGLAGGIESMGMRDVLTSVSEVREITSQLASMGVMQVARDVPEILGRLGETMKAIRSIAVAAQTTMSEAVPIIGELRQAGVTNVGMAVGVVQRMAAGQRAGVSMGQQMQAFTAAGQQAMAMGMGGPGAGEAAAQMTRNLSRARQTGAMSEDDFQRLTMGTGQAEVGAGMMQQANMQAVQGPMAMVAGGALATRAMGAAPFGQFLNAAAGNLSDPNAMVALLNRQDEIASTLASDQFSMVRIARSMAETLPGNRDEMTMLVMQRRFGLSSFQARMMNTQFNARHQLQLGQTMDDMMQAETNRRNTILREHTPMALVNRFGRATFEAFGGREMTTAVRGFMAGTGRIGERFARRLTGGMAMTGGRGTEAALAGIISGTGDITALGEMGRTRGTDAAGGFLQAFGLSGAGRRRGGAIFEEPAVFLGIENATGGQFGGITEGAVESLVGQVRSQVEAASRGEADADITALANRITRSGLLLDANQDVVERFQALATNEEFDNIPRSRLAVAAAVSNERTGRQLLNRAEFGKLDLNEIQAELDESQSRLSEIVRSGTTTGPTVRGTVAKTAVGFVPGGSLVTMTVGVGEAIGKLDESGALIDSVMQDPQLKDLMMSMADAYGSDKPEDRGRANSLRNALQTMADKKLDKNSAQKVRQVAGMFSQDPATAKAFGRTANKMLELRKELELGTAAAIFGASVQSGLGTLREELREGPMAGLVEDIAGALQQGNQLAFRRGHQRLVARAITETEIAQSAGDMERLSDIRQIFQAAGLESITEAIDELTPAERGKNLAQGIIKAQQESARKLGTEIEGGGRAGGRGGPGARGGAPDASYFGRLTEHITLLSRSMEAVIAGDTALAAKIRKDSAELVEATGG